jgi:hypothetical protein
MSWYAIDAVDRAFSRTRKALFEPFDFWKWLKLAIIIFFVGGMGSNFGGSGTNYHPSNNYGNDFPNINPGDLPDFPSGISGTGPGYIDSVPYFAIIAAAVVFFILLVLIFSYISSVMEFVFVESLVKNEVRLRAYFKKFMGKGFNLLLIRLSIMIIFLILFILALLPFIPAFLTKSSDFSVPTLVGGVFWLVGVIILLVLIGAVVSSFLSLAIPISIYRETGILSAFRMVYRNFRKSWQEVLVYWFIRFLLRIGIGILVLILFGLLILGSVIAFLIIDGILYFLFSTFISEPLNWILLIPFVIVELLLIFVTLLLLSVPFAVFLKYHLLSFLEKWFVDADIPFFDQIPSESETGLEIGPGTELNKSEKNISEHYASEKATSEPFGAGPVGSGGSEPIVGHNF